MAADADSSGCGGLGAEVLLWTFVEDQKLCSTELLPWPADGEARFDATFSTSAPRGAATTTTEFTGEVYRRDGRRLPPGTRVEAIVGDTVCAVASVKRTGNFSGYVLAVVGPDSVAGCRSGARLRFRIDGREAIESATHGPDQGGTFDLTVR